MNILALDLGTKTGWAMTVGNLVESGTWDFSPRRFEGGGMRFLQFRRKVSLAIELGNITQVYFEEVRRHLGTDAAHIYGGLMAHLTAWCEERNIPYQAVPVGTIKKHATGKGNASKIDMIAAAVAQGWKPKDDNEADALWLLDLVRKGKA